MKASTRVPVVAAVLGLLAIVGLGAVLINAYIEQERQRDLLQWESRLSLVADGKADAVYRLLAGDQRDLEELADNASLRFYLWQVTRDGPGARGTAESGALGYLRNLLLAAAERHGYLAAGGQRVPANMPQPRSTGLAIFNAGLEPVVVTPGLTDAGEQYTDIVRAALAQPKKRAAVLVRDAQDHPVIVMAVPVGAVPGAGAGDAQQPLGVIIGVRSAEEELYPLLTRGPAFAEDSESLLLEKQADVVSLLSPMRDGSPALRRTLPADRGDLAEAQAVAAPGGFTRASNYRGQTVLQVSRMVRGQDWVLAQQVDAAQALGVADERRRFLLLALSLLLFSIVAVAVAAWRHGSSVRALQQAGEMADKAARLQRQTDLLHTISDNLDVLTLLATQDGKLLFTNQAAASAAGTTINSMVGNPLGSFLPPGLVHDLQEGIEGVRQQGGGTHRLLRWERDGKIRDYFAGFIPVERIGDQSDLTLLVLGDVTELRQMQKKNTDLLRHLVLTLVSAVDRHDPYSANHAQRMTQVADALARELGFSDQERSTLDLAASLANIGKIMIPVEVLTKREPLTAEEQQTLHKHVEYGLELLKGLQFEGPVLDIIAQKQERPDGRGYPRGLAADRLSLAGQVLAVSNAFVALVSGRAYRAGMTVKAALDELMRVAGSQFDRRVIAALFHVAENRQDWTKWQ